MEIQHPKNENSVLLSLFMRDNGRRTSLTPPNSWMSATLLLKCKKRKFLIAGVCFICKQVGDRPFPSGTFFSGKSFLSHFCCFKEIMSVTGERLGTKYW